MGSGKGKEGCAASFWAICPEHQSKGVAYSFSWPASGEGVGVISSVASSAVRATACPLELNGQFSAL